MAVGLVIVSHVEALADGVRTLAGQMAPEVAIGVAGGTDDGRVGTSFDKVGAALDEVSGAAGDGVLLLYDLGSAQMTAEMALELLDPERQERVRLADVPLVEGAIAAATAAQGGADLDAVEAAARSAYAPSEAAESTGSAEPIGEAEAVRQVVLKNPAGLHARPAALLAQLVQGYDATVTLGRPGRAGANATAVLAVVAQGIRVGGELEIRASGPDADAAADAVLAHAEDGFGELDEAPAEAWVPPQEQVAAVDEGAEPGVLRGITAAAGIGIGPVRHLRRAEPELPPAPRSDSELVPEAERAEGRRRLEAAYAVVDGALSTRAGVGGADGEIASAHRAILADPSLRPEAERRIAAGLPVERAWWDVITEARELFSASTADATVAERAADVEDLGRQVLVALGVPVGTPIDADGLAGSVIVATDLLPSEVRELAAAGVDGIALAGGGRTAHASIIAAGLGLPMVVRLGPRALEVAEETGVILDADSAVVQVDPPGSVVFAAKRQRSAAAEERDRLRREAAQPVVLDDGRRIHVEANVASLEEARAAVEAGADGVGLLRTELLYVDRADLPGEDEQVTELTALFGALEGRPIVVRTLDVGGDKMLPALRLDPWRHGPLGVRGLRYFLDHPDVLRTQVRAVLRAAAVPGVGPVSLMAPMVTVPSDVEAFVAVVTEAGDDLAAEGVAFARPAGVGVMVEVPAAAFDAEAICAGVDFVSVGSNDLQQYLMAADRTNEDVTAYDLPEHPALWQAVGSVAEAGRRTSTRVAVCGSIAARPDLAGRLVELGVTELSMPPTAVPAVKAALR